MVYSYFTSGAAPPACWIEVMMKESTLAPPRPTATAREVGIFERAAMRRRDARVYWLRMWGARIVWAVHRGVELSLERRMQCSAEEAVGYHT